MAYKTTLSVILFLYYAILVFGAQPPNIVFILADDLGWDGVSFHGSREIQTPNIDALAYDGIILNNYYTQYSCTPSRAALLTGRYPIHTGMQHGIVTPLSPHGLGLDEKLLPEYLKELGYSTHIVGKWHLGHYAEEYLPTNRGFDSHYGYLNVDIDYFNHFHWREHPDPLGRGYDFRHNESVELSKIGSYSTDLFSARAEHVIGNHNKSQPLFLYLAHQAPHFGTGYELLQAPAEYTDRFQHLGNQTRQVWAAMHSGLDDAVANVTEVLLRSGMLNNTLLIFSSDNGGEATLGVNWPLRGSKSTLWEGGSRAVGFIWSPLLEGSPYVSNHLMHISDWLPTLLRVAGYNMDSLPYDHLDGFDMWDALSTNQDSSPRTELLYNIDQVNNVAALRVKNMKVISGSQNSINDWYVPPQNTNGQTAEPVFPTNRIPSRLPLLISDVLGHEFQTGMPVIVNCGERPTNALTNCDLDKAPCLYDLDIDPCEYNNLATLMPETVSKLLGQLKVYNTTAASPRKKPEDDRAYPIYHCGSWGPWIDLNNE